MLSVIVPCYNEAEGIDHLKEQLLPVLARIEQRHAVELLLIDDGSTDDTYARLQEVFGGRPTMRVIKHERNQNLGGAIRTGFRESSGEWVANFDSDCTYVPEILEAMLREIEQGADLVTVSPYHPMGQVQGVPLYRLVLSKSASVMYRLILRTHIHTITAMVRIYRRSIYERIASPAFDFTCVTEMMLRAIKQNVRIAEIPAVLSVRQFGQSKLRIAPVIVGHLRLMARLIFAPHSFSA